ncbi:hypothetical protein [Gandjariella thermophila]|uniref:Uncharacterized protein n=1 Tax=Gandjariella thermophila TaxID=1931992 RepID=A0A4D4JG61_9PSEU|nr:hypothetical protein [Gandjariella thermophila]GDY34010.1 hypothetical protein GTS_56430 [Gandjariella thermophila]
MNDVRMNHDEATALTLERLLAVDWSGDTAFDHRGSRVALMREYLRRAACWAQQLDATDEWPFFDVAAHVDPTARAHPTLVERLEKFMSANIGWPAVRKTCLAALHWSTLRDSAAVRLAGLEGPFEPLIVMYERGGGFTTEHGFIEVGLASVRLKTWEEHSSPEPVVSLEASVLNALDDRERG